MKCDFHQKQLGERVECLTLSPLLPLVPAEPWKIEKGEYMVRESYPLLKQPHATRHSFLLHPEFNAQLSPTANR